MHTLGANLPPWLPALPVRIVVAVVALVAAVRARAGRWEPALAAALLGSLLVTPYVNDEDLIVLLVAAWLLIGRRARRPALLALLVSYPVLALSNQVPAALLLGMELTWLIVLAAGVDPAPSGGTLYADAGHHPSRARGQAG